MSTLEITSLPLLSFSHVFRADHYKSRFPPQSGLIEIAYLASGSLLCRAGEEERRAKQGDVLCLLRDREISVRAEAPHCHHTALLRVDFRREEGDGGLTLPLLVEGGGGATEGICRLIDEMIFRGEEYKKSPTRGGAKALELLLAIDRAGRRGQAKPSPGHKRYASKAKEYIQEHLTLPITQAEIASHLGITPEYLCAVFKQTEGVTVMHYVNKRKLEGVAALMENKRLHLYEAAAMYGYGDPNYVSRLYKQTFGRSITREEGQYLPSWKKTDD